MNLEGNGKVDLDEHFDGFRSIISPDDLETLGLHVVFGRMTRSALLAFLRRHRLCVQSSVDASGAPQAAVVGFAVSDGLEFVFDTLGTSRKMTNLRRDARIALVVGWDDEQSAQIEGVVDEPTGAELERIRKIYFAAWPDGVERLSWRDITHVRVRPTWIRYSDFRPGGRIVEWGESDLRSE